ncbi:hypothetical protein [Elizabethkingia argenteiflava]|uniref:hypothetical protein n=1 Tax=Elizabethkingia argenteiflava TaxID=2681556 RepID=UPI00141317EA|nr:hypothetical protein [Elizabethkingia argenteiflava]
MDSPLQKINRKVYIKVMRSTMKELWNYIQLLFNYKDKISLIVTNLTWMPFGFH